MTWHSCDEPTKTDAEWLSEVPQHWTLMPLKYIFEILSGSTPNTSRPEYWAGEILWVTPDDLGSFNGHTIYETKRQITEAGYKSCGTTIAKKGSLIVSTRAPIGHVAIAGDDMCTNQGCRSLVFRSADNNHYFYYVLLAARPELESWGQGTTFNELARNELGRIYLPRPPLDEQNAIASFLDNGTERIDKLIASKERLIELLQEKQTVLTSHISMQGLNPNVSMQLAKIEWLGELPHHWSIARSKHIFFESKERSLTGDEELLTVSHKTGVTPRAKKNVYMFMAESLEGYKKCQKGDLVINTMWAWMGALGIAWQDGVVSPSYNVYRFRSSEFEPRYYDRLLRTPRFLAEVNRFSKGVWKSRLRLYPEDFFLIRLPVPPLGEQRRIADFLDKETKKTDSLIKEVVNSIQLLRKYRFALISAAITGIRGEFMS